MEEKSVFKVLQSDLKVVRGGRCTLQFQKLFSSSKDDSNKGVCQIGRQIYTKVFAKTRISNFDQFPALLTADDIGSDYYRIVVSKNMIIFLSFLFFSDVCNERYSSYSVTLFRCLHRDTRTQKQPNH